MSLKPTYTSSQRSDRRCRDRDAVKIPSEFVGKLSGRLISPRRVFIESFQTNRIKIARYATIDRPRGNWLFMGDLRDDLFAVVTAERWPQGEEFVQSRPEGINVGPLVDVAFRGINLFRRHVVGRADDFPRASQSRFVSDSPSPKSLM